MDKGMQHHGEEKKKKRLQKEMKEGKIGNIEGNNRMEGGETGRKISMNGKENRKEKEKKAGKGKEMPQL